MQGTPWILVGIFFLTTIYFLRRSIVKTKINKTIFESNQKEILLHEQLTQKTKELQKEQDLLTIKKVSAEKELKTLKETLDNQQSMMKSMANSAYSDYCETLESKYKETEKEYDHLIEMCAKRYDDIHQELINVHNQELEELDKLRKTRESVVIANVREQEIKEQLDFYCLQPTLAEITDIKTLEEVKKKLFNPRILSMLIWSTFFQKNMTALCNRVLKTTSKITGIYKITNQTNDKCYIGQSLDIATRWKDHAKHGLGIDAPASNKLYNDMQEIGIWNFSWELLEECSREQLNEKERYYIDLYQSDSFGYNSTKGNK